MFSTNVVYGYYVRMCRSGGLFRLASLMISSSLSMVLTSCLVRPLEDAFSRASTVFARVVFTSENPSLESSIWDGALIPSRLLG